MIVYRRLWIRRVWFAAGLVAVLLGLLFMAQGSGVFPYPKQSFMISQAPWIYRGAGVAVIGAVAMILAVRSR